MKITILNRSVFRLMAGWRCFPFLCRPVGPAVAEQLVLDLEEVTESGLRLAEALPVRSAEYWLRLGHPELALKELDAVPESARQHPWWLRVHLAALQASSAHSA